MTSTTPNPSTLDPPKLLPRALVYYGAFIVLGLIASAYGPTLPDLAEQTGSTLKQISTIFSGSALGYILGSFLGGWLYDRRKGHPVLVVTLSAFAFLLILLPLAPSLGLLVVIALTLGFGMGILDVGGNTLIVWLFGREVGPYMNALHLAFGLGAFLSPLLIDRVVVATGGIRGAYWTLAALVVPVVIWLARVPSPTRSAADVEREESASPRRYSLLIFLICALFFMHVGVEQGFGGWIFSYGLAAGIGPETTARLLNATYWGALTLGRLVSIPLALKLSPRQMLLFDLWGALASLGLLVLLPGWAPAAWIATFGLGFFVASMFPASINYAERRMPISGRVTAFFLVGANFGSMTLPWLIGQTFESVGPASMTWILAAAMALGLTLFYGIMRYSARSEVGKV
jgi:FHS family Na+ dependent glucose MFS transporter 1